MGRGGKSADVGGVGIPESAIRVAEETLERLQGAAAG